MRVLSPPEFPSRLASIPLQSLELRGQLPDGPSVAIVGARDASVRGVELARQLARDLARQSVAVISGGALGIDAAAHEGAIEVGGRTVVVLPTGVEVPVPKSNRPIFDRVLELGGAWVAERPLLLKRAAFARRNRLIAALADMVVVVEASGASGTRHTVAAAERFGRKVGAVPWFPTDRGAEGCLRVLASGGVVVRGARDVFCALGIEAQKRDLTPPARILQDLLRAEGNVERLAEIRGASVAQLLQELAALELEGFVERRGPSWCAVPA